MIVCKLIRFNYVLLKQYQMHVFYYGRDYFSIHLKSYSPIQKVTMEKCYNSNKFNIYHTNELKEKLFHFPNFIQINLLYQNLIYLYFRIIA